MRDGRAKRRRPHHTKAVRGGRRTIRFIAPTYMLRWMTAKRSELREMMLYDCGHLRLRALAGIERVRLPARTQPAINGQRQVRYVTTHDSSTMFVVSATRCERERVPVCIAMPSVLPSSCSRIALRLPHERRSDTGGVMSEDL